MKHLSILMLMPLVLAGCDMGTAPAAKTKLDAVEVEPGTASDAMILLDDSDVDGTAVDNGAVMTAEGQAAAKAETEKAAAAAPTEGETAEDSAAEPTDESSE